MGSKSDQFVHDLIQFYRNRGQNPQPQQFIARINGKVVNLSELYSYVIESGGSFKVNQLNLWDDIFCRLFKTSTSGANISVALRQIYSRYLLPFERQFSTTFGSDLLDEDEDESNFSFNSSHNNHNHNLSFNSQNTSFSIPFNNQYQCPQTVLSTSANGTENRNPLNKLFCSLLSGLPNELDLALKVSTILVNSNRFDWNSDYKYVNLLLECSKNYCCVCRQHFQFIDYHLDSDINGCHESELQYNCDCYQRFWYQCCSDEQTLDLAFSASDPNFNLNPDELPEQDFIKMEERIQLIADIIRNLSFTYEVDSQDKVDLSSCVASPQLMRFLLLLSMSSNQSFNNTVLDIMSNIAPTTAVTHEDNDYTLIQQTLHRRCVEFAMTSNNIHYTSRSLEIISRLFASNNEEINVFLEIHLKQYEVFDRVTQLMTCQYDISLLLAILEFCLSLSQQRPYMLLKDENKHLIKIILTLLNTETSQHFTTTALKRMRVIDDRPRAQTIQTTESNSGQQTVGTQSISSSQNSTSQTNSVDNETFAMNWLRTTYEPITNFTETQSLKVAELYADYVKYCCRSSRRNVMAAQPFSQLIKRCFPSISLTNNQTTIEGIAAKTVQNSPNKTILTPVSQLMSPILKAHLSAPPKNTSPTNSSTTNCNNTNLINNNSANATTSGLTIVSTSSPIPTTNTSTLIKSLLANKLRSNATLSSGSVVVTTSSTPITPIKSSVNTITTLRTTPLTTTPVHTLTTTTSNSTNIEINGESVNNSLPPLPSTTFTTISLTPTHPIITASNASISGQSIQPQQQFLLVRTIITSQQQGGGSGLTTTGTPVRLILPASMLTQQRLNAPTVNGITTTATPLTSVTFSPANYTTTTMANSSDLFLKTVLSNSNTSNALPVTPIRSNVKSSPLLNVLLDKGKLPEFSTTNVINNQITGNSLGGSLGALTNSATLVSSQTPKMYILTTKSPLAIKSLPALQTQQLNQTAQCVAQTTQLNTSLKSCLLNTTSATTVNSTSTTNTVTTLSSNLLTMSSSNHSIVTKQSIPKSCITHTVNGEIGPSLHAINSVLNSVNTINITNNSISAVNTVKTESSVSAGNTGTTVNSNCVDGVNTIVTNDLSSIKDIKKAVDDAPRLIAKRPNEDSDSIVSNKKFKTNSVLTIPSSLITNHDLNSLDSNLNSLSNCLTNSSSQQVLNKTSTLLTTNPTMSSTITTITSNNTKGICNTNIVNNCNEINDNNSNNNNTNGVKCDFECQWNDCKERFSRAAEVFLHVHNHHIMPSTFPQVMTCLWGGQEGTGPGCLSKRPKLSLLTHLLDFHCNPNVLQQDSVRKRQLSSVGSSAIVLPQPPAHPGYAHNAALLAIRRHANNYVEAPTLPPITEWTPLTVSIRLTAALILRNLAVHSNFVKRTLEYFEQYLCELCMSEGRDESRTIAQCLAVITDNT